LFVIIPFLFGVHGVHAVNAADNLSELIGESRETTEESTHHYSISASGPLETNLQEVQLLIETTVTNKKRGSKSESQKITLKTGKTKTVSQVIKLLEDVFHRFHMRKDVADKVYGTLGNLNAGGVLKIRSSGDNLLFVFRYANETGATSKLSRSEVAGLLLLLQNQ